MKLYSRDRMHKVRFDSNLELYRSRAANWRDTLTLSMFISDDLDPEEVPAVCRETMVEYIKHVTKFGGALLELLSEALGLRPDHLQNLECCHGRTFVGQYYPPCPEPELASILIPPFSLFFFKIILGDFKSPIMTNGLMFHR